MQNFFNEWPELVTAKECEYELETQQGNGSIDSVLAARFSAIEEVMRSHLQGVHVEIRDLKKQLGAAFTSAFSNSLVPAIPPPPPPVLRPSQQKQPVPQAPAASREDSETETLIAHAPVGLTCSPTFTFYHSLEPSTGIKLISCRF